MPGPGVNKHHVLPKRYQAPTPLRLAHITCHIKWHKEIDNPRLHLNYYLVVMSAINFGRGVYCPSLFYALLFPRFTRRLAGRYPMPTFETMKLSDAPEAPKKLTKVAEQMVSALNSLKKDEVLKLSPDDGKSLRGLKTSLGRIASNADIKVESWSVDDNTLYVRKV